MALETLADVPVLWGVVYGLIGVGIWVGGLLFFNWMWNHYRDGDDRDASHASDATEQADHPETADTAEATEPAEAANGDRI